MALSGDLEVSLLDEMPPGRPLVRTMVVKEERRHEVYERVRVAVGAGRQAYLVYPLVEESETLPQAAAETMARELPGNEMKGLRLGLVRVSCGFHVAFGWVWCWFGAGSRPWQACVADQGKG